MSQLGQDKIVDEYLKGKRNGVFVEIGAYDGVTYSNTLMFERERGWTGLCIEPLPDIFKELVRNRTCSFAQVCISDTEQDSVNFLAVQSPWVNTRMLSGMLSHYHPRHPGRVDKEIAQYGGSKEIIKVPTRTLPNILKEYNIHHVDYLSIDTEGAELAIVQSTNMASIGNPAITFENNYKDPAISQCLIKQGYRIHSIISFDRFYVYEPNYIKPDK